MPISRTAEWRDGSAVPARLATPTCPRASRRLTLPAGASAPGRPPARPARFPRVAAGASHARSMRKDCAAGSRTRWDRLPAAAAARSGAAARRLHEVRLARVPGAADRRRAHAARAAALRTQQDVARTAPRRDRRRRGVRAAAARAALDRRHRGDRSGGLREPSALVRRGGGRRGRTRGAAQQLHEATARDRARDTPRAARSRSSSTCGISSTC